MDWLLPHLTVFLIALYTSHTTDKANTWLIITMASEEVLLEDVIIKDKFVICLGGQYGVGKSSIFRILMSEYCGVMRDGLCRETDTDYCQFDVKVDGQICEVMY